MEVNVVRFSRPLLIRTCKYKEDYFYQTIYGFQLPEKIDLTDPFEEMRVEQYMGYLCGIHCWSSGDSCPVIKGNRWVDENGEAHTKQDEWMTAMEAKFLLKLGLTYDVVTVDVDEDEFRYSVVNEDLLVVNEEFYYDIERLVSSKTPGGKETPLWDDDLPF